MRKQLVALLINYSSLTRRYDLGEVGRYRINKKLDLDIDMENRSYKEDII